jgi:hypothetical protein
MPCVSYDHFGWPLIVLDIGQISKIIEPPPPIDNSIAAGGSIIFLIHDPYLKHRPR